MLDRQEIERAIVVLEAQRAILGDDVVDISLATLRQKLDSLQAQPVAKQYEHIVVLVADLSGFTAMSELLDAEEVRDTVNALWEKLDNAVIAWGGEIDKHTGDGLIALFGVPSAHKDDSERAVLAAMDMQMELSLLNDKASTSGLVQKQSLSNLQMRIGIDSGPVFFGEVGISDEYTSMGDAVSMASHMQRLAPEGGILISFDVYSQVHMLFDVEPRDPVSVEGKTHQLGVYLVKEEKPHALRTSRGNDNVKITRMAGRQTELEQLQLALQATMGNGTALLITLAGEAGIGKSRLLYEFEESLKLLPVQSSHFNGTVQRDSGQFPYELIRDLFVSYFGIHMRSSPAIARQKLSQGIMRVMKEDEAKARERAHYIGQLLGFNFSDSPYLQEVIHDAHQIREHAFRHIAEFFTAVASNSPVTVLILEDVQWADERSLDLIDYLYQACRNIPLLIICSGRPSLFENRSSWPALESTEEFAYQHLKLVPLSPIDSRHLISELFRDKPQLPLKMIDLIVERTGGNPFYITELIEMLIEDGVIIRDGSKWRVQMGQMQDQRKLPSLTGLLQARLDQLPQMEKRTLQQAAVFGRIFWKSAVIQLAQAADNDERADQIEAALQSLEETSLIYHHNISGLAGVQEYVFGHNRLRSIAYESIPLSEQRVYHAQAAAWLIVHSDPQIDEYAPVIASHFERGGNITQAAKWYDRAGAHARATHAPETAIQLYRKALDLLSDEAENAPQIITLREALGETLRWLSRFATAIEEYGKMLAAARSLRNAKAEARALLGIIMAQNFQGDYAGVLNICDEAEEIISDFGSSGQLAEVWASKAWALVNLDEVDTALDLAKEALSTSTSDKNQRGMAYSHALIGYICRKKRWYDQAVSMTEKALALFQAIGDRMWEGLMFGNLGQIAYAQRDYSVAINFYQDSLVIAVDIGDHHGTVRCLRALGDIAQHQDDYEQAASFYQQALVYANKGHNDELAALVANDLGQLFLTQATEIVRSIPQTERLAHLEQATIWFQRALASAQIVNVPLAFSLVKSGMARLLVEKKSIREALPYAQEALNEANRASTLRPGKRAQKAIAVAWRTLGAVIGNLSSDEIPEFVDHQALDASSCFKQSLQILHQLGSGAKAEIAHTLYAWAEFELRYGDHLRGKSLLEQARNTFT